MNFYFHCSYCFRNFCGFECDVWKYHCRLMVKVCLVIYYYSRKVTKLEFHRYLDGCVEKYIPLLISSDDYRLHPKDGGRNYFQSVHMWGGGVTPFADGVGVPTFQLTGGYLPWVGTPSRVGTPSPSGIHSSTASTCYVAGGGRYASCIHAGGLSCCM